MALAASCVSGCGGGPGRGGSGGNPAAGAGGFRRVADSIDTQLKGNVVGYVALIGTSKAVASGLARTAADPPRLAMGPDVMVNVASVGKMFTTIAVLKSLARQHLSIDSPISPFLPPDWVKGPGVDTITFRELLTHQAGFRLDSGRVFARPARALDTADGHSPNRSARPDTNDNAELTIVATVSGYSPAHKYASSQRALFGMCVSKRSLGGRECPGLDCAVVASNFTTSSAGTRPRS